MGSLPLSDSGDMEDLLAMWTAARNVLLLTAWLSTTALQENTGGLWSSSVLPQNSCCCAYPQNELCRWKEIIKVRLELTRINKLENHLYSIRDTNRLLLLLSMHSILTVSGVKQITWLMSLPFMILQCYEKHIYYRWKAFKYLDLIKIE